MRGLGCGRFFACLSGVTNWPEASIALFQEQPLTGLVNPAHTPEIPPVTCFSYALALFWRVVPALPFHACAALEQLGVRGRSD